MKSIFIEMLHSKNYKAYFIKLYTVQKLNYTLHLAEKYIIRMITVKTTAAMMANKSFFLLILFL